jgi:hypothetical protein
MLAENKSTGPYCKKTGEARFWKRVKKSTGCWIWTGHVQKDYGAFWVGRKFYFVHRYSWQLHNGDIPKDMCVLHKCDNPVCVRPDHLFLGTPQDNVRDRDSKNRQVKGEIHWCAKLTDDIVRQIRKMYKFGVRGHGASVLARKFGVSTPVILGIVHGKGWKHVGGE